MMYTVKTKCLSTYCQFIAIVMEMQRKLCEQRRITIYKKHITVTMHAHLIFLQISIDQGCRTWGAGYCDQNFSTK